MKWIEASFSFLSASNRAQATRIGSDPAPCDLQSSVQSLPRQFVRRILTFGRNHQLHRHAMVSICSQRTTIFRHWGLDPPLASRFECGSFRSLGSRQCVPGQWIWFCENSFPMFPFQARQLERSQGDAETRRLNSFTKGILKAHLSLLSDVALYNLRGHARTDSFQAEITV